MIASRHNLIRNAVAQRSDLVDLNFNSIAWLKPQRRLAFCADTPWGPRRYDVARFEPGEGRAVFYNAWHIENHVSEGCLLNGCAIDRRADGKSRELTDFIRRDHPRTKRSRLRKVLSRRELMRVVLIVPDAAIVVAGITCDVVHGVFAADVSTRLADDDRQLALVVQVGGHFRPDNVTEMPGLRVWETAEDRRIANFFAAGLLAMSFIIQSDAKDLVGVWDRRQPIDLRDRDVTCARTLLDNVR